MQKVILVEFNELCPSLLKKWMGTGELPNFKRLHDSSEVFVTAADEIEPANLEPWIQWYSIHTGLPYSKHRVFHLTDGPRAEHPDIWSILNGSGKKVWNCSSMNAKQFSFPGSAFLPDPWCTTEQPHPQDLNVFHKFVSHQVREYSNAGQTMALSKVLSFLLFMVRNGLSIASVIAVLMQFVSEFRTSGKTRWQRVAIQDRLLFDVFRCYFKRLRPDFSTFFSNSTAHLQHSFWRHMEPEKFLVQPTPDELDRYRSAILFGYQQMDRLLGDVMRIAGSDTRVLFASALSQQPYLKYEHVGGHNFYRPRSVEKLFGELGLRAVSLQPEMTHQFLAIFDDVDSAIAARRLLESLIVDDRPVFGFDDAEPGALYFGCQIRTVVPQDRAIHSTMKPELNVAFAVWFYKIEGIKSGRHHPDGCFWIQTGHHIAHDGKASILDILPTVASLLGVPIHGLPGTALA